MEQKPFDPHEHLSKLPTRQRNKQTNQWETSESDYLEVKWRMVWFREDHKQSTQTRIVDKIIDPDRGFAYFELEVTDSHQNSEMGVGSETAADFHDYIEKAYTKAYGRALAALGYGTQFAPELNEGDRIVDAPVARQARSAANGGKMSVVEPSTTPQRRAIYAVARKNEIPETALADLLKNRYPATEGRVEALTKQQASDLIDFLQTKPLSLPQDDGGNELPLS